MSVAVSSKGNCYGRPASSIQYSASIDLCVSDGTTLVACTLSTHGLVLARNDDAAHIGMMYIVIYHNRSVPLEIQRSISGFRKVLNVSSQFFRLMAKETANLGRFRCSQVTERQKTYVIPLAYALAGTQKPRHLVL